MKSTILVIDDNSEIRENISEILTLADYNVLEACEGKKGLQLARENHPDLILCDIMMPVLDGYGVFHALQNNSDLASTAFVFLTGETEKNDFRTAMDLGADDYLAKPFTGDALLKVVNTRLKKIHDLKKSPSQNMERLKDFIEEVKAMNKNRLQPNNQVIKKYKKKEIIIHEGDKADYLYVVVSGKVKTVKINYWGKEYITDLYKEGDFFGYIALLDGNDHKETAISIDNSEIALISKLDFFDLLHSNNDISDSFIKMLTDNLAIAEEKLLSLAYDSARKKVAEALIFINRKYQISGNTQLSFTAHRENISAIAGLSPESVSRNLTDLREEGLINIHNGSIKILNLKKLESLK